MAKQSKANHIEIQRGSMQPYQTNYRYMTQRELVEQDMEWQRGREDGKRLTLHEPKK